MAHAPESMAQCRLGYGGWWGSGTMSPARNKNRVQRAYAFGPYGEIHYRRAGPTGARSPLLLLHPCPSSSSVFEAFVAEMGRDRSAIAPDLPGFGMSDPPEAAPTMAFYAAAMLELVAELGLGIVDVMGYHMGGLVAVEMARQQPYVVRKMVLIGAPAFTDEERKRMGEQPALAPADDRAAGMAQGWTRFKADFWRMGPDVTQTWNHFLDGQRNPEMSAWARQAMLAYDLAQALPALGQPILVLNPDDDLKDITPRAAKLMKNGRVHHLPGWTHGFLDAKTKETATLVHVFLDQ